MHFTCSDNNRASTVLLSFTKAVQENGLPSYVRSDLGGENVDVWRFMLSNILILVLLSQVLQHTTRESGTPMA